MSPATGDAPGAPVIAVVGATATGKSDLAVQLALDVGGEIINADSMQLYRGMDIGTAKITVPQRRGVPHHLLDVLDVTEEASVAAFQVRAREIIDDIRGRGRVPIMVGGSGLYVRAATDVMEFPGTDPAVRSRLEDEIADAGTGPLHRRLAEQDPVAAAKIADGDARRIVRALEVIALTGRPFSAALPEYVHSTPTVQIGLTAERGALRARIAERVRRMWDAGWVDEVRELLPRGLRRGPTASRAIGYAQIIDVLDARIGEQEALDSTIVATRRFAKRQETWFRRDPRIRWLDSDAPDLLARAVEAASETGATGGVGRER